MGQLSIFLRHGLPYMALSLSLTSCAVIAPPPTPADQQVLDTYTVSGGGEYRSVGELKQAFRTQAHRELPTPPGIAGCRMNGDCYFTSWRTVYNEEMMGIMGQKEAAQARQDDARRQQEDDAARQQEERCMKTPACRLKREKAQIATKVGDAYDRMMHASRYTESLADMMFRSICTESVSAQKAHVSKDATLNRIRDRSGISPSFRPYTVDAADVCWESARLGYNWKEAIRVY